MSTSITLKRTTAFQQAIERIHSQALKDQLVQHNQAQMYDLIKKSGESAFDRNHPQAHFTCSAFVFSPQSACLALFHKKLQRWLQPGGHVEVQDPSPLAAALREAQEESALQDLVPIYPFPIDLDIHKIPARPTEPEHFHFDLRYAFFTQEPHKALLSAESTGLTWLSQEALQEWQSSDESIGRAVRLSLQELRDFLKSS